MTNDTDLQYQTYPAESIYGSPQNGNVTSVGLLMAQFAMGVMAVAASDNPSLLISGDQVCIRLIAVLFSGNANPKVFIATSRSYTETNGNTFILSWV